VAVGVSFWTFFLVYGAAICGARSVNSGVHSFALQIVVCHASVDICAAEPYLQQVVFSAASNFCDSH
jgi:hypothetical protein